MANEVAMTQNQSPTVTSGKLIENTVTEQLLVQIADMRRKNLTAKQQDKISNLSLEIRHHFFNLTWKYFGIDYDQVLQLSDQKLKALFTLVSARAHKTSSYMRVLFTISILGWLAHSASSTFMLNGSTQKLKKMLGNSFDLVKIIRN